MGDDFMSKALFKLSLKMFRTVASFFTNLRMLVTVSRERPGHAENDTEAAGLQIKRELDIDVEEDEVKLYPLGKLRHRHLQQKNEKKIHVLMLSLCLDTLGGYILVLNSHVSLQIICSGEGAATQVASHRVRVTVYGCS
jgi:hypothetical protein